MSNLTDHAKAELKMVGLTADSKDSMDRLMYNNIMAVVQLFSSQGHSGFSSGFVLNMITRLLRFEPITPLTGNDDEWNDVSDLSDRKMWQNRRCSRIIKEEDGTCYDMEGKVFTDPEGHTYTNRNSWVKITFPYIPKTEFVSPPVAEDEE